MEEWLEKENKDRNPGSESYYVKTNDHGILLLSSPILKTGPDLTQPSPSKTSRL